MTSHNVTEFPIERQAVPVWSEPRPMYWSILREMWENKSIYIAPLIVAAVVLFGSFITLASMPYRIQDPVKRQNAIVKPFKAAPAPIMLASFVVATFYCLDALYGERRDRSILFWKSLPVSDRTTVLSKAAIPFVVLPLIAYGLSIISQIFLLSLSAIVAAGSGMGLGALSDFRFFEGLIMMFYGLSVHVLWFAPIYGWLLMISAWARRAPLLWAVLPPLLISAFERIVFGTMTFMKMLQYRVAGAMKEAFALKPNTHEINSLRQLDIVGFLTAPGLWLGLLFAALFLVAAARLRRNREPI